MRRSITHLLAARAHSSPFREPRVDAVGVETMVTGQHSQLVSLLKIIETNSAHVEVFVLAEDDYLELLEFCGWEPCTSAALIASHFLDQQEEEHEEAADSDDNEEGYDVHAPGQRVVGGQSDARGRVEAEQVVGLEGLPSGQPHEHSFNSQIHIPVHWDKPVILIVVHDNQLVPCRCRVNQLLRKLALPAPHQQHPRIPRYLLLARGLHRGARVLVIHFPSRHVLGGGEDEEALLALAGEGLAHVGHVAEECLDDTGPVLDPAADDSRRGRVREKEE